MTQTAHILVVDDDVEIRKVIEAYLVKEGYRVTTAGNGTDMTAVMAAGDTDLVILDLVLPGEDGFDLARRVRAESDIGIIMLTGKGEVIDRVVGLEIGADDYLTKPFSLRELLARVRSVLRRQGMGRAMPKSAAPTSATFSGWRLNFHSRELRAPDGRRVLLTTAEYRLLAILVKSAHKPLDRDQLSSIVVEREWTPYDRSIDVLVGKLRQKLEPDASSPTLIKTERGVGYLFSAEVDLT